jgi:hypothetical protein
MGFSIFAAAEETDPKYAGVGKTFINLTMMDSATALTVGLSAMAFNYLF